MWKELIALSYRRLRGDHSLMLTMYSTTWCGYCRRLATGLDRAGIPYSQVNIELDENAAELVTSINGGNRTVPTVVVPDGTALTNPTVAEVTARLTAAA
jgi:mycoredoxin